MSIDYNDPSALFSDTSGASHWASRSLEPEITLVERIRAASIGAQPQEFGSPYWRFSANFSELRLDEVRKLTAFISKNKGLKPFLFYDRFRPYPETVMGLPSQMRRSAVKPLTLTALSKEERTVTVSGQIGDVITVGDPFAVLVDGKRYYNRALDTIKLTGSAQSFEVEQRPKVSQTGLSVNVERIRPCCAFALNMQRYNPPTGGKLKEASIQGVEWTGASS